MNPELEFFLERVFDPIQPTSASIGRVVVDPDYDVDPDEQDEARLADELVRCIQKQVGSDGEFEPPKEFPTLAKYVRTISLHQDSLEGSWVEVSPPGNWI